MEPMLVVEKNVDKPRMGMHGQFNYSKQEEQCSTRRIRSWSSSTIYSLQMQKGSFKPKYRGQSWNQLNMDSVKTNSST
eukprot:7561529-Ditylum_brightwellii.AAC.1